MHYVCWMGIKGTEVSRGCWWLGQALGAGLTRLNGSEARPHTADKGGDLCVCVCLRGKGRGSGGASCGNPTWLSFFFSLLLCPSWSIVSATLNCSQSFRFCFHLIYGIRKFSDSNGSHSSPRSLSSLWYAISLSPASPSCSAVSWTVVLLLLGPLSNVSQCAKQELIFSSSHWFRSIKRGGVPILTKTCHSILASCPLLVFSPAVDSHMPNSHPVLWGSYIWILLTIKCFMFITLTKTGC